MFAKSISTKGGDVFRDEYSLAFDGTNDYVVVGDDSSLDITDKITLSVWIKPTDVSQSWQGVIAKGDLSATGDVYQIVIDNGSKFRVRLNNSASLSSGTLSNNTWYHICSTYDKDAGGTDEHKLFIDGVLVDTADYSSAINTNNDPLHIGIFQGSANCFFGNISEVAIYNSALTANQVKTIYNGREPYNHKEGVVSGNLQAWYRMGDGALDEFDSKENGLIQSYNSQLQSSIVTSWTNASAGFNTLNATGTNITSMINNDSGTDNVRSNSLTVATTDTYKVSFDIAGTTIPSSINKLMFKVSPNNALNSATYDGSVTGAGSYVFYVQPQTTTIYVGFRAVEDVDCNVTNFKMQKITNNSGLMKNMTATDIEGDTP
tara:strand:- start:68 stop:1192 length:1125 start_codon:yes stop_codon:yes gene_type:complete